MSSKSPPPLSRAPPRIRRLASHPADFSKYAIGIPLRPYQQEVADAILKSILGHLGLSFVVIFPRQSGKNETQAHIQAYLLCLLSTQEIEIVSVSPTYIPQARNAIRRLQRCLDRNPFTSGRWKSQDGFIVRLDKACVHFFSGSSVAQTVGATASALLSVDEAQDVRPSTYDRKFAPMVAENKATRVFWGTPWTSSTLLAREQRRAQFDQEKDGIRRLWTLTADDVSLVHPLYGEFVSGEVLHYGRTHPYIKTQYFSEELDSQASMFNPSRIALIFPSGCARGGSSAPTPHRRHELSMGGPEASYRLSSNLSAPQWGQPLFAEHIVPEGYRGDPPGGTAASGSRTEAASSRHLSSRCHEASMTEDNPSAYSPSPFAACPRSLGVLANGEAGGGAAKEEPRVDGVGSDPVAFLIDLAGQDESRMDFSSDDVPLENPARDSASLSIVSIDLSTLATLQAPTYRILHRLQWTGLNHLTLFGQLKALSEFWNPQYIVMDATGVGEGLWAMLDRSFPGRVIPVKFNRLVKSELGWKFLSIIDTGRFRDCSGEGASSGHRQYPPHVGQTPASDLVRLQYSSCRSEILPGPSKTLRWGVPDGARGPDGQLIHDDILLADALVAALDSLEWVVQNDLVAVEGFDPLSRCEGFLSHANFAP